MNPNDDLHPETSSQHAKPDIRENLESAGSVDAELIFFIPEGVQLIVVEGDKTSAPTAPTSLQIFKLEEREKSQAKAFIQVGPWAYPLIGDQTPVLKKELGTYVVQNPTPDHPEMFVTIILPRDIEKDVEEAFTACLALFTELRTGMPLESEEKKRLSDKIAGFLVCKSASIAGSVQSSAQRANTKISARGTKIRSKMEPTTQPTNINPMVRNGVHYVHKGSKVAARVTSQLLDTIGGIGVAIGQSITKRVCKDPQNRGLIGDTCAVLGGGIIGVGTIWISLEEAGATVFKNIADETVDTVNVRYGDEAAATTHKALFAAGNTGLTALLVSQLGLRSVADRVVEIGAIEVVLGVGGHETTESSDYPELEKPKSA